MPRHCPYIPRLVPNNLWVLWCHSRVFIVTLEIFIEAVNFCESHVTVSGKIMNTVKHAAKNLRGTLLTTIPTMILALYTLFVHAHFPQDFLEF